MWLAHSSYSRAAAHGLVWWRADFGGGLFDGRLTTLIGVWGAFVFSTWTGTRIPSAIHPTLCSQIYLD
jgi:hypothetical protein